MAGHQNNLAVGLRGLGARQDAQTVNIVHYQIGNYYIEGLLLDDFCAHGPRSGNTAMVTNPLESFGYHLSVSFVVVDDENFYGLILSIVFPPIRG